MDMDDIKRLMEDSPPPKKIIAPERVAKKMPRGMCDYAYIEGSAPPPSCAQLFYASDDLECRNCMMPISEGEAYFRKGDIIQHEECPDYVIAYDSQKVLDDLRNDILFDRHSGSLFPNRF